MINIFVKATYEEILYRFYIVNRLKYMISYVQNIKLSKFLNIFAEIIAICLFALAHKYLGIFAILNAFFAAIYLRILIWKTNDNLLWNIVVHSLYNIIVIFLTQ
ncbi:MAG: CPBP family intramembrane metalloprotease [Treponema sp.]|nr:CPBP family intramembrane metalloprotease [Treponema sp.]